jgi:hypothetical protein
VASRSNNAAVDRSAFYPRSNFLAERAKTVKFLDNTPLNVTRFDRSRISAEHDDVSYEFDRQGGTLNLAGSATKDGVTTVIVGSGPCESGLLIKRENPQK